MRRIYSSVYGAHGRAVVAMTAAASLDGIAITESRTPELEYNIHTPAVGDDN